MESILKQTIKDKPMSGLEGVVASETRLSSVDGLLGELIIAGFPLEDFAGKATFEETIFLLWNDGLPTQAELSALSNRLTSKRSIEPITLDILRAAADKQADYMDALRMAASTVSLNLANDDSTEAAETLIATFPTIIAAYHRLRNGDDPIEPRADLSHAANYLYMLTGAIPATAQARALETYLNTVVDHGFNASTFTARVIISTQSDMVSAVVGALGALKGPLHGGAPGPALDMVFEIGTPEKAESILRDKLERGERLMGFGHRVYKVRDPRADVLSAAAEQFFVGTENESLYQLVKEVEAVALRLLEEYKPGRRLQTNVEFYTALVLHGIDLPTTLFTPTFAIGRVGGWTAHAFEQQESGRLIRPQSAYTGERGRAWVEIDERD
jgi:citrate synthase